MYFYTLLIVSTVFIKVVYVQSFDCINYIYLYKTAIHLSTSNFPATVDWGNRPQCHFEFENESGNSIFIITNGYLKDVLITLDNESRLYEEIDTNKNYYQFIGNSITFQLLSNTSKSETKTIWQAFQGFIYLVNDSYSSISYTINMENMSNPDFSKSRILVPLTPESTQESIWFFLFKDTNIYLKVLLNLNMKDDISWISTCPYIAFNHHSPYSTNGTEIFKVAGVLNLCMIKYHRGMQPVDYGSMRGLVTVADRDCGVRTNCTFNNTDEGTYIFSSFDLINGYENNAHCSQWIKAKNDKYFVFWFQTFYLEEAYDNVTVQNVAGLEVIKIQPGHIYIAPSYDILFRFDSDGGITQAGFEVFIQEYDCVLRNVSVTIPCSGTIDVTFFANSTNPHMFCSNGDVYIHHNIEEECANESNFIVIHYHTTRDSILTVWVKMPYGGGYTLNYTRTIIPVNFLIHMSSQPFVSIMDTTNIWCLLTLYRIPEPKVFDTLILNKTITHVFFDLSRIPDNSYIEIRYNFPKEMVIDYYFVTDSDYGALDFYEGFFETYKAPINSITTVCNKTNNRRFMPTGCTSSISQNLIYTEKQYKNYSAFMFVRIHDLETSDCLFEHNVIDAMLLAEKNGMLTMVNNGTGTCTVVILNAFLEGQIYLDEFWTDAVSDPIESLECINYINVNDGAIYVSTPNFPATVDWNERSQCHFKFEEEVGNFIFIITNGYLNDVVITWDKEISHHGPYSTYGKQLFKVAGILNYGTITYHTGMQPVDYGSLRGLVTIAGRDYGESTNCTFLNNTKNIYIFSSFDLMKGYENNAHCSQWIKAQDEKQLAFWFQSVHLEETYDIVTVQNVAGFEAIKIQPEHIYITPSYDTLFQFDSDGSITQAGFELFIQQYDCSSQKVSVTVPCSGTVNTTSLENFTNPHIFCFAKRNVLIDYKIEEECANETEFIAIHYNITQNSAIYGLILRHDGDLEGYTLKYKNTIIPVNFLIAINSLPFFGILDTTDIEFSMTLYRIPEPKVFDTLILNKTITHVFFDLSRIPDNSYIEIRYNFPKEMVIDYYFVTDSDYGVLDFYEGFFETYKAPINSITTVCNKTNNRRFMLTGCTSSISQNLIYTEKQHENHNAFIFARVNNVDNVNCLFEHNVINASSLAEEDGKLTMVNNGTGTCTVTLLNPLKEKGIYLDEFWTNAVSDPIEVHDEKEMLFNFTKFDKVGQFVLENNFYKIVLPPNTSFTVIGHEDELILK